MLCHPRILGEGDEFQGFESLTFKILENNVRDNGGQWRAHRNAKCLLIDCSVEGEKS